ncbi:hypothetical protein OAW22_02395 [Pseudomonadales bacterium]|nr:hypothetical protein [Pseudomonadales bacterium]
MRAPTLLIVFSLFLASSGLLEQAGFSAGAVKIGALAAVVGTSFLLICLRRFELKVYPITLVLSGLIASMFCYVIYSYGFNVPVLAAFLQVFAPLVFFFSFRYLVGSSSDIRSQARIVDVQFKLTTVILSAQILAAVVKFALIGQEEGRGIGTLSVQAGSLSTFVVVLICTAGFWCKKLGVGIAVLAAAFFFAWVNEKRLGVLIVAVSFGLYFYFNLERLKSRGTRAALGCVALPVIVVVFNYAAQSIDSILHGYSIWQLPLRVFDYLNQSDSSGNPIGRLAGLIYSFENPESKIQFLFGTNPLFSFGSSALGIASSYADVGFRPSAFAVTFVRFGITGSLVWAIFFWHVLTKILHEPKMYLFAFFIVIDFLIYSDNLFVSYFCMLSIYVAISISGQLTRRVPAAER